MQQYGFWYRPGVWSFEVLLDSEDTCTCADTDTLRGSTTCAPPSDRSALRAPHRFRIVESRRLIDGPRRVEHHAQRARGIALRAGEGERLERRRIELGDRLLGLRGAVSGAVDYRALERRQPVDPIQREGQRKHGYEHPGEDGRDR